MFTSVFVPLKDRHFTRESLLGQHGNISVSFQNGHLILSSIAGSKEAIQQWLKQACAVRRTVHEAGCVGLCGEQSLKQTFALRRTMCEAGADMCFKTNSV